MEIQNTTEKLSNLSYWDDVLKSAQLPRVNTKKSYLYSVTMKYIDAALKKSKYNTFFEVGCGSSGWLPYFAMEYNFTVSGLDYSDIGCRLAKKNLELLNINYGDILCRDIFSPDPTDGKKYDVVFSYGVIEHFSDPGKTVGIFKNFLQENGLMITLVPNLSGLSGRLTKKFLPEVFNMHNVISPRELASYHTSNSLEIIKNGYAGNFAFGVTPWVKSKHWLFKDGTFRRKALLFFLKSADIIMGNLFRILPFTLPSRLFSPYIICIAKKR